MKHWDRTVKFNGLLFYIMLVIFCISSVYSQENQIKTSESVLRVYYFRTNKRCVTCRKIEKYTQDVIESDYQPEREQGMMSFQTINVSERKHKHFIDDYKLITKSVVLSRVSGGEELEWRNLDKIWTLTGNQKKFKQYIRDSIDTMLVKVKQ